ncbi:MAG: hypothetical protein LV480_01090 [Methylacidiphilales bacterium]|nr:hypothetical protein [Candidatus Methylacidiphilales bacterium]
MNKQPSSQKYSLLAALILLVVLSGSAFADDHSYQVTGPVLAVTDTSITVKKGSSPWTVSRDASTQVTGNLAVGSKVTIKYHMVADTVTVK